MNAGAGDNPAQEGRRGAGSHPRRSAGGPASRHERPLGGVCGAGRPQAGPGPRIRLGPLLVLDCGTLIGHESTLRFGIILLGVEEEPTSEEHGFDTDAHPDLVRAPLRTPALEAMASGRGEQ